MLMNNRQLPLAAVYLAVFLAACSGSSSGEPPARYDGESPDPYMDDGISAYFLAPEIPPSGGHAVFSVYEGGMLHGSRETDKMARLSFSMRANSPVYVAVMAMLTEAQLMPFLRGQRSEINQTLDDFPSFYGELADLSDWDHKIFRSIDALQIKSNHEGSIDIDIWMGTPYRGGITVDEGLAPQIVATIRGDVQFACVTKDGLPDPSFSSEFCAGMIEAGAGELFGIELE